MAIIRLRSLHKQAGNIIILSGLSISMLVGFAALALDSSLLYVARNELQNAADAGALAATRVLYLSNGTAVNPGANQVGHDTGEFNNSLNTPVEVDWVGGNAGDVERGHWSFASRTFTPNASLLPVDLFNSTTAELDANTNFINAVKVTARRQATPVQSILAGIFGIDNTAMVADAVAYIGFAGRIQPRELDQPIAICRDRLLNDNGEYSCSVGTFIPSNDKDFAETGAWTNMSQADDDDPQTCGTTSNSILQELVCSAGNVDELILGHDLGTTNGQNQSTFQSLWDCWDNDTSQAEPWNMTLPVIDCVGSIAPCNTLVGAVNVNVIYIVSNEPESKIDDLAPTELNCTASGFSCPNWSNYSSDGKVRWNDFVDTYNLVKADGSPAYWSDDPHVENGWRKQTIYFLPDCSPHIPSGRTGGENFGVLAKVPVLVE